MPKTKKTKDTVIELDLSSLGDEQAMTILENSIATLCSTLEQSGVDPDLITSALFSLFADRMATLGDREQYEMILAAALEEPWLEYTVH